jgi:hypothetical protein
MTTHIRNVALARPDDALRAFKDVARRRAAEVRAGKVAKQTAVDDLHNAATAYGLVDLYGVDEIQGILGEAFHARKV